MSAIARNFGGGATHSWPSSKQSLAAVLRDVADDLAAIRTFQGNMRLGLQTLCQKLDADAGVTDTNYNATVINGFVPNPPVALLTTKA